MTAVDTTNRVAPALKRLLAWERELTILDAAAVRLVPLLEAKYELCRVLHEDAQHALALTARSRQLRDHGPLDPSLPASHQAAADSILHAPSPAALLLAIARLKDAVATVAEAHAATVDRIGDGPSRELLQRTVAEDRSHLELLAPFAAELAPIPADIAWVDSVFARVAAGGGLMGEGAETFEPVPQFEFDLIPPWGDHPIRFNYGDEGPDNDLYPYCWGIDPQIARVGISWWLFNEADCLDYMPPLFVQTRWAPVEFHADLARHLWDESRHSRGGFRGLQRAGIDPATVEHPIRNAVVFRTLRPWEVYCVMTQLFEAGSFGPKREIIAEVDRAGDDELSAFMRYDRADETTHVTYGKKWVEVLARHDGVREPLPELMKLAGRAFQEASEAWVGRDPAPRTMAPGERISLVGLAAQLGIPLPPAPNPGA